MSEQHTDGHPFTPYPYSTGAEPWCRFCGLAEIDHLPQGDTDAD